MISRSLILALISLTDATAGRMAVGITGAITAVIPNQDTKQMQPSKIGWEVVTRVVYQLRRNDGVEAQSFKVVFNLHVII